MFSSSLLWLCNLIVAGIVCIYGFWTSVRPMTPLFYKIIVYAFGSYFLSMMYSLLFLSIVGDQSGFHVGYMGYAGTFFFLFSSYFGALDRLADDKKSANTKYRVLSLIPALLIFIMAGDVFKMVMLIPVAGTAYFACKHLTLPDVEMGIIRVLRPYNIVVLLFCLVQPFTITFIMGSLSEGIVYQLAVLFNLIFIAVALPQAFKGVQKWFI